MHMIASKAFILFIYLFLLFLPDSFGLQFNFDFGLLVGFSLFAFWLMDLITALNFKNQTKLINQIKTPRSMQCVPMCILRY